MKTKTMILIGITLVANSVNASVMSLVEAKDKLAVISAHETESKRDYDAAKSAYKKQKQARKTAIKQIKAIIKADAASLAAEQASLRFNERVVHFNPYLNEDYLGSGSAQIKGGI